MTRKEYIDKLEELLRDVPDAEREEALQYYNDYFDDASEDGDDDIIKSLGSPEDLAKSIKDGLSDDGSQGMFTEGGYETGNEKKSEIDKYAGLNIYSEKASKEDSEYTDGSYKELNVIPEEKKSSNDHTVLMIVLFIIALPILISIFSTIIGVSAGLIGAIVGIGVALVSCIIALTIVAFVLVVVGVCMIPKLGLLGGLCVVGAGLICAAGGIFSIWLTGAFIYLAKKLIPAIFAGIKWVWNKLFTRKSGMEENA